MRAALALLTTAGIAIGAGALGYQAGVTSAAGAAGAGAGTVVIGAGFHLFGMFLFLPFLFFSFIALAALVGGRRRHHGPWGMHWAADGRGGWGGPMGPHGPFADGRRAWVAEAHRKLHEEEARAAGTAQDGDAPKAG